MNKPPRSARRISTIESGYKNISTGIENLIIVLKPRFEKSNDIKLNIIAHERYLGPLGKRAAKVSEQLVISPTAVFKQARVIVAASMKRPMPPK